MSKSTKSSKTVKVEHEVKQNRFVASLPGSDELAYLEYEESPDNVDLKHTFVPTDFRGQGIAAKLVTAGFAYAKSEGKGVIPTCEYIMTFINNNPEYELQLAGVEEEDEEGEAGAAPDAVALSADDVDLGAVMSAMSREQIEMLLIRMVAMHPEGIDLLLDESQKTVNVEDAVEPLILLLEDEASTLSAVQATLASITTRVSAYTTAGVYANAVLILEATTGPFVSYCVDLHAAQMLPGAGSDERLSLDACVTGLEDCWLNYFQQCPRNLAVASDAAAVEDFFKQLADWRTQLSPLLGPIFSDPLRHLKKLLQAKEATVKDYTDKGAEKKAALPMQQKRAAVADTSKPSAPPSKKRKA